MFYRYMPTPATPEPSSYLRWRAGRKMNYQIYICIAQRVGKSIGKIKRSRALLPWSGSHTIPHISLYICAIKENF